MLHSIAISILAPGQNLKRKNPIGLIQNILFFFGYSFAVTLQLSKTVGCKIGPKKRVDVFPLEDGDIPASNVTKI